MRQYNLQHTFVGSPAIKSLHEILFFVNTNVTHKKWMTQAIFFNILIRGFVL